MKKWSVERDHWHQRKRGQAVPELDHAAALDQMLNYRYGRLSPEMALAVEQHVRHCPQCQTEGLRHIATERIQAMQEKVKTPRRSTQSILVGLTVLLFVLICVGASLISMSMQSSHFFASQSVMHDRSLATALPTKAPPTPTPFVLAAHPSQGTKGIVTVATAPDGKSVAVGINPASLGGTDAGGVVIYSHSTTDVVRLPGFENYRAPGSLVWSSDGHFLAASGRASVIVWDALAARKQMTILLPDKIDPTLLYVFDVTSGAVKGSVPQGLLATTGYLQWDNDGALTSAPPAARDLSHLLAPGPTQFALWGPQQGCRIFRSATNAVYIGVNDMDRDNHSAFMRFSPDNHYLVWGYPALLLSSTLTTASATPTARPTQAATVISTPARTQTPSAPAQALQPPTSAFALLGTHVSQSSSSDMSVLLWMAPDGQQIVDFDMTATNPSLNLLDAGTGMHLGATDGATIPANPPLNVISWQSVSPASIIISPLNAPLILLSPSP